MKAISDLKFFAHPARPTGRADRLRQRQTGPAFATVGNADASLLSMLASSLLRAFKGVNRGFQPFKQEFKMIYHRNFVPEIDRKLFETLFLPLVWVSAAKFIGKTTAFSAFWSEHTVKPMFSYLFRVLSPSESLHES